MASMSAVGTAASPLLSVEGLEVRFGNHAPAVRSVDLTVLRGQTVAVVGESGSGKSTTAAAILGLLPPGGRITAGRIVFDGRDITRGVVMADRRLLRSIRGRCIGYVPQDPMTNLNPVWKVGFQVREALRANTDCTEHGNERCGCSPRRACRIRRSKPANTPISCPAACVNVP